MTTSKNHDIPAYVYLDGKNNAPKLQFTQAKARAPSISSFFSSNSMEDKGNHELFGFRRLAKHYLLGPEKSIRFKAAKQTDEPTKGKHYAQVNATSYQLQFRSSTGKKKSGIILDQEPSTKTHMLHANGEMIDYELDVFGIPQKVPDLLTEENPYSAENMYVASSSEDELLETHIRPKGVVLGNIPNGVGITSILAQTHGGPLENIKIHTGNNQTPKIIELNFLSHEAAHAFMKYARTNMFKVNGQHLTPQWGKVSEYHSKKDNDWNEQKCSIEDQDFCRCLIMKKYMNCTKRTKYSDEHKESPLEQLNVPEIRQDFGAFGKILEITPVVSRKLCISINFFNMESAMKAMKEYENPTSDLHKTYFKNWAIWYGKDITDRPCLVL